MCVVVEVAFSRAQLALVTARERRVVTCTAEVVRFKPGIRTSGCGSCVWSRPSDQYWSLAVPGTRLCVLGWGLAVQGEQGEQGAVCLLAKPATAS